MWRISQNMRFQVLEMLCNNWSRYDCKALFDSMKKPIVHWVIFIINKCEIMKLLLLWLESIVMAKYYLKELCVCVVSCITNYMWYLVELIFTILSIEIIWCTYQVSLFQGAANRKVAATNMNRASSRSHSVFTCVIESKVCLSVVFFVCHCWNEPPIMLLFFPLFEKYRGR